MTDSAKMGGIFQLFNYRLPKHLFTFTRVLNFLSLNKISTAITRKYGVLQWQTDPIHNLIMNTGRTRFPKFTAITPYVAYGTSSTAPAVTQTTLISEITTAGLARAAATLTNTSTNITNDTATCTHSFTVAAPGATVNEIGLFDAATAGNMIGRGLTGTKAMTAGDSLVAVYNIVFA